MITDNLLQQAEGEFKRIIDHLKLEYSRLQIGRASSTLVEGLMVEAYGTRQPLKAVANVSIPDPKTIQIQPWDKSQLGAIEKAIQVSGLNLNPTNDGIVVRINIPPLTEERRKDLTKVVQRLAEEGRISVRHTRQNTMDKFKTMEKNKEITEDEAKTSENRLQARVDTINKDIEALAKNKEHDILTI
jgi:ribosome recycling factor